MTDVIAGVEIPDSAVARAATELVREAADDLLFHHSRRVYLWGTLKGRYRGLEADPDLLYVGAMFHDLGLTEKYRTTGRRFEIDGAESARAFLLDHGYAEADARQVWYAIALHTTPGVPEHRAVHHATPAGEEPPGGAGRPDRIASPGQAGPLEPGGHKLRRPAPATRCRRRHGPRGRHVIAEHIRALRARPDGR
jgi:hypothetical protein